MPLEPAALGDVSAKNGMVRSHRFLAANTALPFLRGDGETLDRVERNVETAEQAVAEAKAMQDKARLAFGSNIGDENTARGLVTDALTHYRLVHYREGEASALHLTGAIALRAHGRARRRGRPAHARVQ